MTSPKLRGADLALPIDSERDLSKDDAEQALTSGDMVESPTSAAASGHRASLDHPWRQTLASSVLGGQYCDHVSSSTPSGIS